MRKFSAKVGVAALSLIITFGSLAATAEAQGGGPPPGPPPRGGGGGGDVVAVDCDDDGSIQEALDEAKDGDTINVSGICNERIDVRTDGVTIDGGDAATIDGTGLGGAESLVVVEARNVRIQNITVTDSPGAGIHVRSSGSVVIEGTTIKDNATDGIRVNQSAYARIGSGLNDHPAAAGTETGNDINHNGKSGIAVRSSATADISHNSITINERGINITNAGSANIAGNDITDNTARGISLLTSGAASLSQNTVHSETNEIEENVIGIRCRLGGSASGTAQDFGTGNPGGDDHTNDTNISGCHVESTVLP